MAWRRGAQVIERGYEGYVAKDEASAYEAGPTRCWLKVKQKGWASMAGSWTRPTMADELELDTRGRRLSCRGDLDLIRRPPGVTDEF
jgi:hypothetical protein